LTEHQLSPSQEYIETLQEMLRELNIVSLAQQLVDDGFFNSDKYDALPYIDITGGFRCLAPDCIQCALLEASVMSHFRKDHCQIHLSFKGKRTRDARIQTVYQCHKNYFEIMSCSKETAVQDSSVQVHNSGGSALPDHQAIGGVTQTPVFSTEELQRADNGADNCDILETDPPYIDSSFTGSIGCRTTETPALSMTEELQSPDNHPHCMYI
jgi:hypothetical protein